MAARTPRRRWLIATVAIIGSVLVTAPHAVGAQNPVRCQGEEATIVGTDKRDVIRGTSGRDVIAALGGNDVVRGLGGDDLICGGPGRDRIIGGGGDDEIYGEGGPDRLLGNRGDDLVHGGGASDRLLDGGPGNDRYVAGRGTDRCEVHADRDEIVSFGPSYLQNPGGNRWCERDGAGRPLLTIETLARDGSEIPIWMITASRCEVVDGVLEWAGTIVNLDGTASTDVSVEVSALVGEETVATDSTAIGDLVANGRGQAALTLQITGGHDAVDLCWVSLITRTV